MAEQLIAIKAQKNYACLVLRSYGAQGSASDHRMGQYASGSAPEMVEQARTLFVLSKDLDLHYMERRIREETGNDISDLQV